MIAHADYGPIVVIAKLAALRPMAALGFRRMTVRFRRLRGVVRTLAVLLARAVIALPALTRRVLPTAGF